MTRGPASVYHARMSFNHRIRIFVAIIAVALVLCVAGCAQKPSAAPVQSSATPSKPILKSITPADLVKLRWIEGSWRGTGEIDKPFYERYKFETDTTLAVESFDDEAFSKATDVSRFELKDGEFGSTDPDGRRSAASAIDANSVTFEPVLKSRNTFRFERESENSWKAILTLAGDRQSACRSTHLQNGTLASSGREVIGRTDIPVCP